MCLRAVHEVIDKPTTEVVVGWKVFHVEKTTKGQQYFPEFAPQDQPHKTDRWLKATETMIYSDWNGEYQSGFHFFHERKDAVAWGGMVVKVYLRRVRTRGLQDDVWLCSVADEMWIPVKKKPKGAK